MIPTVWIVVGVPPGRTTRGTSSVKVVEARPADFTAQRCEELSAQLTRIIKQNIGVSSTVDVVEPGTLERSLGKAQRIRDLRPTASRTLLGGK